MSSRQVSASALSTYHRCPEAFDFKYNKRVVSIEKGLPLITGSAFHAGAEAVKDARMGRSPTCPTDVTRSHLTKAVPWTLALATELMVSTWQAHYENDGLSYVKNEFPWEIIYQNIHYRGIFDGMVEERGGDLWVIEHKTTSSKIGPNDFYWNRLTFNPQTVLYYIAAKQLGYKVKGIIYDVIHLPGLKLKKATLVGKREVYKRDGKWGKKGDFKPGVREFDETKPQFAARLTDHIVENLPSLLVRKRIEFTKWDTDKALKDFSNINKLMDGPYFRNPQGCHMGRYSCEYLSVCRNEESINNPELYKVRR